MKLRLFNTLQKKITIIFTSLIVILLIIYSIITYLFDSKAIYDEVSQANLLTIEQLSNSFDLQIELMEKASKHLATDPLVINLLSKPNFVAETSTPNIKQNIFRLFSYTQISWSEIENLFIYDLDGNYINNKQSNVAVPNPKLKDYQRSDTQIEYGVPLYRNRDWHDTVISFLRLVRDPISHKPMGWIRIDINMYRMNFVQNLESENRMFMVLRPNGRVIYTNIPKSLDIIMISKLLKMRNKSGSFPYMTKGSRDLIDYYQSSKSNWIIASITPEKSLIKD